MGHPFQPLARLGAFVIGVDASEENIKTAQAHVIHEPKVASKIKYIQATVEDLVGTEAGKFDAVVASEVVEHVAEVSTFVTACCELIKVIIYKLQFLTITKGNNLLLVLNICSWK